METFSLIPTLASYSDAYVWFLNFAVMAVSLLICGLLGWYDTRAFIKFGYHVKLQQEAEDVAHHEPIEAPPAAGEPRPEPGPARRSPARLAPDRQRDRDRSLPAVAAAGLRHRALLRPPDRGDLP